MASHVSVCACFGARLLLLTVILVPEPSEGADRVAGQLCGAKEFPVSGITKSGRRFEGRSVPESGARSVARVLASHR